MNLAGQVLVERFTAQLETVHYGHWNRRLIGRRAAHFKQEMTQGGQTGSTRRNGNVVPVCSFPSVPIPSLRCGTTPGWQRRGRGKGVRKSERGGHSGESPLPPGLHPLIWNCSERVSAFQNADSKHFIVSTECRTAVLWRSLIFFWVKADGSLMLQCFVVRVKTDPEL